MSVTVEGQRQVTQGLTLLVDDLADLEHGYAEIATYAASTAAGFVRSRTYRLARSLRGTAAPGRALVSSTEVYAGPQNYGWPRRGIRPQKFLQRADQVVEPKAVAILQREADQTIQRRGFA